MFEELIGGLLGRRAVRGLTRRRAERSGRAEIALRVVEGTLPGLRTTWFSGVATLFPGRLEFTSYVGGVRFLRRKRVPVEITAVDRTSRRTPEGKEIIWINPDCDVIAVRSPTATLELGVLPPQLDWVLARLARHGDH
ncbi:hypothetical protein [Actinophytocola sp.]|uniref:hypothetical protein n=1 Tax=Actinophytocola sp. TaxID=1872138 RepID=UPI002ED45614